MIKALKLKLEISKPESEKVWDPIRAKLLILGVIQKKAHIN